MWIVLFCALCLLSVLVNSDPSHAANSQSPPAHLHCRDPEIGSGQLRAKDRKFLVLTGHGGGIGNYLIFYPAAYYFAALTGRDIVIADSSLLAEMCKVIICAFPLYSHVSATFPSILPPDINKRGAKVWDFARHLSGEGIITDKVVNADGYKYASGWYNYFNFSRSCIPKLTGCPWDDISCHDRHALQHLIRGPFFPKYIDNPDIYKTIGVPGNLKRGMMTLPHALAPRLDAAVHLRCQFRHFEFNVGKKHPPSKHLWTHCNELYLLIAGPEDSLWSNYMKEVDDFLNSTSFNGGLALFQQLESKIMSEIHLILKKRNEAKNRRRRLMEEARRSLSDVLNLTKYESVAAKLEDQAEHDTYHGDASDRIYIYLASDNDRVKDAFATYLIGHANISVMRVTTDHHIIHAKDINYLKTIGGNGTAVYNLVMDWYSLSLSNIVFAWRRDTGLTSTYAQVSN